MSKQRHLPGQERVGAERGAESRLAAEVDVSLLDQVALGNAALQGRMGAGEQDAGGAEGRITAEMAAPLVHRAILALQLDPADPDRLGRLTALLEASSLPDRGALVERLVAAESTRTMVDAALDRTFGAHDAAVRDRVDATLASVFESLRAGALEAGAWRDSRGEVEIGEERPSQSGTERALGWIERLAERDAPGEGERIRELCRTIATSLLLDEDEDESDTAWTAPEEDA